MTTNLTLDLNRCVGLTDVEIQRLREAWQGDGPGRAALQQYVADTRERIAAGIDIPPEGGQHNQWYQCDDCQFKLETVDAHHHQCTACGKVYSGWPYDNVLYNGTHHRNGEVMRQATICWRITGETVYADYARQMLLGYTALYTKLPRIAAQSDERPLSPDNPRYAAGGHISNQTLNEAMLMVEFAHAFSIVAHSGQISDAAQQQIIAGLIRPMAQSIQGHRAGKSNWQTWHNAALVNAAAVMDDMTLADFALNNSKNGFFHQMNISVLPGGVWYENSWGYHYYTLTAMTEIAEAVRRLGGDIYTTPELRAMYLAAFDFEMPDGSLPRFGDAVGASNFRNNAVNEPAYARYQEPSLASVLPDEPTFLSILYGRDTGAVPVRTAPKSIVMPHSGQAILRWNQGDTPSTAAVLNFGPYGGFHGHYDKLSVIYYARGREMGIDPGRAASQAYRLPIHTQWYKSTISHNTIMIDAADQQPITGELYATEFNERYATAFAGAPGAFEGASHDRFVMLVGEVLIVMDRITSLDGQLHRLDWLYHNAGQAMFVTDGNESTHDHAPLPLITHPGATYLKNINARAIGCDARVCFAETGQSIMNVRCQSFGLSDLTLRTCDGPFASVEDRVGCMIFSGTFSKQAFIASVIAPPDNDPDVRFEAVRPDSLKGIVRQGSEPPIEITYPVAM